MTLSCYQPRFNTSKDLICTLLFASDQPQQCGTGERTANRHLSLKVNAPFVEEDALMDLLPPSPSIILPINAHAPN